MGLMLMIPCAIPMICAAITDARKRIIPDWTWIVILLIGGISALFCGATTIPLFERVAGLVLTLLILLITAIKTDGIGGGDIKLIAAMAFCFGLINVTVILLFSTVLACIYSFVSKQKSVPLAVFLCAGFFIYFAVITR